VVKSQDGKNQMPKSRMPNLQSNRRNPAISKEMEKSNTQEHATTAI
jgi:hypothetical protein